MENDINDEDPGNGLQEVEQEIVIPIAVEPLPQTEEIVVENRDNNENTAKLMKTVEAEWIANTNEFNFVHWKEKRKQNYPGKENVIEIDPYHQLTEDKFEVYDEQFVLPIIEENPNNMDFEVQTLPKTKTLIIVHEKSINRNEYFYISRTSSWTRKDMPNQRSYDLLKHFHQNGQPLYLSCKVESKVIKFYHDLLPNHKKISPWKGMNSYYQVEDFFSLNFDQNSQFTKMFEEELIDGSKALTHAGVVITWKLLKSEEILINFWVRNDKIFQKFSDAVPKLDLLTRWKAAIYINVILRNTSFSKVLPFQEICEGAEKNVEETIEVDFKKFYTSVENTIQQRQKPLPNYLIYKNRLICDLLPFQEKTVNWLIHRENCPDLEYEDLYKAYPIGVRNKQQIFYFGYFGVFVKTPVVNKSVLKKPGGILADEMGVGKTVEVLSLITTRPRGMKSVLIGEEPKKDEDDIHFSLPNDDETNESSESNESSENNDSFRRTNTNNDEDLWTKYILAKKVDKTRGTSVIYTPTETGMQAVKENERRSGSPIQNSLLKCATCNTVCVAEKCNWRREFQKYGPFKCPHCIGEEVPLEVKTTLIVLPEALVLQWSKEIKKHCADDLKVMFYFGVNKSGYLHPRIIQQQDIILTTYETLRNEFDFAGNQIPARQLRNGEHCHKFSPSSLLHVGWWRLVLDESQLVEGAARKTPKLCRQLKTINKWCVTGTPLVKSVNDIYGLFNFLDIWPLSIDEYWRNYGFKQYKCQHYMESKTPLIIFYTAQIMRRTMKSEVKDEMALPLIYTYDVQSRFALIEERNYREETEKLKEIISTALKTAPPTMKLWELPAREKVYGAMTKLREALISCGGHIADHRYGNNLDGEKVIFGPETVLMRMIRAKKIEIEDCLRSCASSLFGMAGVELLKNNVLAAIEYYGEVVKLMKKMEVANKKFDETLQIENSPKEIDEYLDTEEIELEARRKFVDIFRNQRTLFKAKQFGRRARIKDSLSTVRSIRKNSTEEIKKKHRSLNLGKEIQRKRLRPLSSFEDEVPEALYKRLRMEKEERKNMDYQRHEIQYAVQESDNRIILYCHPTLTKFPLKNQSGVLQYIEQHKLMGRFQYVIVRTLKSQSSASSTVEPPPRFETLLEPPLECRANFEPPTEFEPECSMELYPEELGNIIFEEIIEIEDEGPSTSGTQNHVILNPAITDPVTYLTANQIEFKRTVRILSGNEKSMEMESIDMESIEMESIDMESFEMESIDMESTEMESIENMTENQVQVDKLKTNTALIENDEVETNNLENTAKNELTKQEEKQKLADEEFAREKAYIQRKLEKIIKELEPSALRPIRLDPTMHAHLISNLDKILNNYNAKEKSKVLEFTDICGGFEVMKEDFSISIERYCKSEFKGLEEISKDFKIYKLEWDCCEHQVPQFLGFFLFKVYSHKKRISFEKYLEQEGRCLDQLKTTDASIDMDSTSLATRLIESKHVQALLPQMPIVPVYKQFQYALGRRVNLIITKREQFKVDPLIVYNNRSQIFPTRYRAHDMNSCVGLCDEISFEEAYSKKEKTTNREMFYILHEHFMRIDNFRNKVMEETASLLKIFETGYIKEVLLKTQMPFSLRGRNCLDIMICIHDCLLSTSVDLISNKQKLLDRNCILCRLKVLVANLQFESGFGSYHGIAKNKPSPFLEFMVQFIGFVRKQENNSELKNSIRFLREYFDLVKRTVQFVNSTIKILLEFSNRMRELREATYTLTIDMLRRITRPRGDVESDEEILTVAMNGFKTELANTDELLTQYLTRLRFFANIYYSQKTGNKKGEFQICSVCGETMDSIVMLSCGHSLCEGCYQQLKIKKEEDTKKSIIVCVTCRARTNIKCVIIARAMFESTSKFIPGVTLTVKMERTLALIFELIELNPDNKIIMFTNVEPGTSMWRYIIRVLHKARVPFIDMVRNEIGKRVHKFENDDTLKLLLCSMSICANGLNLTKANHIIFLDPCHIAAKMDQATGRIDRFGQTRDMHIHHMIVETTIDQKMREMAKRTGEADWEGWTVAQLRELFAFRD